MRVEALRAKIDEAYAGNAGFQAAAGAFLTHARETINPTLGEADVREMLIQHILTEEIFAHVFNEADFHRDNNIAKEFYALEGAFFTGGVKRDTLKGLEPGAMHVMFMGLGAPFVAGEKVAATLVFEKAGSIAVEFSVQPRGEGEGGMDHEGMDYDGMDHDGMQKGGMSSGG